MAEYYFEAEGCRIAEWWNTAENEAVSIARARVETGITTSWHKLDGIAERYVVLEGEGRVFAPMPTRASIHMNNVG